MKDFSIMNYAIIFIHVWLIIFFRDVMNRKKIDNWLTLMSSFLLFLMMILNLVYLKIFFPSLPLILTVKVSGYTFPIFIGLILVGGSLNKVIIKKRIGRRFYSHPSFQLLIVGLIFLVSLGLSRFQFAIQAIETQ